MMSKAKPTTIRYRDSDKGIFVPKEYADKHPKTTERQHIPLPTPTKGK